MDMSQDTELMEKQIRAKKMMLWFGIISMVMGFAGWTSAFVVSSNRKDWLESFEIPSAFWYSAAVIMLSSALLILAKKQLLSGQGKSVTWMLLGTLLLGVVFAYLQFAGFNQLIGMGYYLTGPTSNVTISFVYLIAAVHLVHLAAGWISLAVVLIQHLKGRYTPNNTLGFELGVTFWHFVDVLWLYLLLFFYFF